MAFESIAGNLVPGNPSERSQVFVHDRQTGHTICASVNPGGAPGNDDSDSAAISGDGRFVAFSSVATDLAPNARSGVRQVFVHDCVSNTTALVSMNTSGVGGNGPSLNASINADGHYVSFNSLATDLVRGVTNGKSQVYVYDTVTKEMVCASLGADGSQGNSDSIIAFISGAADFVAFCSTASNLVTGVAGGQWLVYVRDLRANNTTCVSLTPSGTVPNGDCTASSISDDGRWVGLFSSAGNLVLGGSNGYENCFVHDRQTGTTTLVSVLSSGAQGNSDSDSPQLSADGRFVVFESDASNLVSGDFERPDRCLSSRSPERTNDARERLGQRWPA